MIYKPVNYYDGGTYNYRYKYYREYNDEIKLIGCKHLVITFNKSLALQELEEYIKKMESK